MRGAGLGRWAMAGAAACVVSLWGGVGVAAADGCRGDSERGVRVVEVSGGAKGSRGVCSSRRGSVHRSVGRYSGHRVHHGRHGRRGHVSGYGAGTRGGVVIESGGVTVRFGSGRYAKHRSSCGRYYRSYGSRTVYSYPTRRYVLVDPGPTRGSAYVSGSRSSAYHAWQRGVEEGRRLAEAERRAGEAVVAAGERRRERPAVVVRGEGERAVRSATRDADVAVREPRVTARQAALVRELRGTGWAAVAAGDAAEASRAFGALARRAGRTAGDRAAYAASMALAGEFETGVWAMRRALVMEGGLGALAEVEGDAGVSAALAGVEAGIGRRAALGETAAGEAVLAGGLALMRGDVEAARDWARLAREEGEVRSGREALEALERAAGLGGGGLGGGGAYTIAERPAGA